MTTDDDPILTAAELEALGGLPREAAAPPGLEHRVMAALRREGRVAGSAVRAGPLLLRLVAVVLLVGLGFGLALGVRPEAGSSAALDPRPRFLLVLYDPIGDPADDDRHRRLAREYGAWARKMAERGHLLAGEPLSADGRLLEGAAEEPVRPAREVARIEAEGRLIVGYFLIRAQDYREAESVAQGCPHLRYGGSILVRRIRS